jgi:TonB-linked SusC/RagA family outer membrane protein
MQNPLLKKCLSLSGRILYLIIFASFIAASPAWAQSSVSGTVKSGDDNSPMPGVNIVVKGTTNGTISDAQGKFSINNVSANDALVISFVGYLTQEVSVSGRSTLDITLEVDAKQLSEVVITALGIEKDKAKVGYATQSVSGSDLVKAREPNAVNSLVGKVAGLNIGASAEILGAPNISLRGRGTLFVVDGVPIQSDTWNISPDDIESYSVLKGPSASALYGSRGINGAIIITTKRGSKDKRGFSVEYNSSTMWENGFLTIPKVQDEYGPGDHGKYAYKDGKTGKNDADYDIWGPKFGSNVLIPQYDGEVSPTETYTTTFADGSTWDGNIKPTPWVARGKDNLQRFLQAGLLSTNNIAVSASGDKYDLRFSYTHSYQKGIVPNSELNSDNFNMSTGFDFSDKLRFESNINYNRQYTPNIPDVQYGPNSMIYNIIIWGGADWDVDDMQDYWEEGKEGIQQKYAEHTRYNNPWFFAKEWLRGHQKTDVYGYMSLNYKITDDLNIVGRTQINTYDVYRSEKFPYSATSYGREQAKGDYREDNRTLFENNTDVLMTYNKKFSPDFSLTASLGGNLRTFTYQSSYVTTDYLNVPASSLSPGAYTFDNSLNPIKAYNFNAPMSVYSAYWLADASYKDWLHLSVTGRWDKHSTLPVQNNTYFYPSASLSVVLSEALELPEVISMLKVRGAYAKVGGSFNSSGIGPIPSVSLTGNPLGYGSTYITPYDGPSYRNSAIYSSPLVYNNQPGSYYSNTITNPDLKPSFSTANELGMDVAFFKNRLGLDFTYFKNIDGPGISTITLPESTGYTGAIVNGGKTKREGFEITLDAKPLSSDRGLNWNVMLNWSTFKETFVEFADGQQRNGFFYVGDRVDKYYSGGYYTAPDGKYIYDAGGRPIVAPVAKYLGNINPDWSWGLVNKFSYRNWSLMVQFDGRVGGVINNQIKRQTFRGGRNIETVQGAMGIAREQDTKGIKSYVGDGVVISNGAAIEYDPLTGAITNYDELQFAPNTTATFLQDWISRNYGQAENNMQDRTYAKLREVTLTYNFPNQYWQKPSSAMQAFH